MTPGRWEGLLLRGRRLVGDDAPRPTKGGDAKTLTRTSLVETLKVAILGTLRHDDNNIIDDSFQLLFHTTLCHD